MSQTTTTTTTAAASPSPPKHGADPSDPGGSFPPTIVDIQDSPQDTNKKTHSRRIKDLEISVPIVYGTIAFFLGRKAPESRSHKWTVYVRGATNEDLGVVIKRVVFQLHPSFENPTRVVESPPFELCECGWGEFDIAISLYFHEDVCDGKLDLYHRLKLFQQAEGAPRPGKKGRQAPVVLESYDEIVFPDPSEGFLARVQNHPAVVVPRLPAHIELPPFVPLEDGDDGRAGDTKDHSLSQWFLNFSEADELLKLAAARQQVQAQIVKLRRQMSMVDGLPSPLDPTSGFSNVCVRLE